MAFVPTGNRTGRVRFVTRRRWFFREEQILQVEIIDRVYCPGEPAGMRVRCWIDATSSDALDLTMDLIQAGVRIR